MPADLKPADLKIVSLLPSATEIVFALGLGDMLRGRSFECDHPRAALDVAVVSGTALPVERPLTAGEIDAQVVARVDAGDSIYTLDAERIRAIDPDVILAQDLCAVCAVPSGAVTDALEVIGCHAEVVSLDPEGLDAVIDCIGRVGAATGTDERARTLMAEARRRIQVVRGQVAGRPRPRVLALEWADPPFNAGHWVPEMIEVAGGEPVLASVGDGSRRLTWREVADAPADVVVFMPCGYDLAGALAQASDLLARPELAGASAVFAVDATAYFSRPGPRVVDGVELLASLLHPDAGIHPPLDAAAQVR
jgi:iron complex transport system substrate-binding protein